MAVGGFSSGIEPWLERLGNLRNVVRQELVTRQLAAHLPAPPAGVLDVGAGQGTQAIRLAERGYRVSALEPDASMREVLREALASRAHEGRPVSVTVLEGGLGDLPPALRGTTYDVVLCHGVFMYLDSPGPPLHELTRLVAPGGLLSLLTRNGGAMAWRPALRRDWAGTLAMLDELDRARDEGRSPRYGNEIGVPARADSLEGLTALLEREGMRLEQWYGVRVATDGVPTHEPPPEPAELAVLLDAEERLGRTDPYRRLGTLMHLLARRSGRRP